jgi:catechol 2,3-dioxygenase-like lactoylglutathione lyase family enzyme
VQIAYIVRDLDEAIERWHAAFSLGPFIVNRHMKFEHSTYRGTASPLDISAAFVQSGDLQIELLCQHDSQPSAFRDMYAEGEEGLHHVAALPEDYARSIAAYQDRGLGAAFIDTRDTWGHMLEVYRDNGGLRAFYRLVANAARDWDGRTLIVDINELSA